MILIIMLSTIITIFKSMVVMMALVMMMIISMMMATPFHGFQTPWPAGPGLGKMPDSDFWRPKVAKMATTA
jgi:hypothetical protein